MAAGPALFKDCPELKWYPQVFESLMLDGLDPESVPDMRTGRPTTGYLIISLCLISILLVFVPRSAGATDWALTLFAGQMTGVDAWHNIITSPTDLDFQETYLVAGALAYTLGRFRDEALSLELEGQVVRHFGDEHLWEFNLPVAARWHHFPWNHRVATTAAFGLGPSYTTEVPPLEVELEGESQRFLYHWFIELTLGPPSAEWTTSFRIHHRSGGFGSVADEGGSNALTLGIRLPL
jgi:hypothetical protein